MGSRKRCCQLEDEKKYVESPIIGIVVGVLAYMLWLLPILVVVQQ